MYVFIYSKVAIVYTDIDIPENQRNWLIACGVDIHIDILSIIITCQKDITIT